MTDIQTLTKEKIKLDEPGMYDVIFLNDNMKWLSKKALRPRWRPDKKTFLYRLKLRNNEPKRLCPRKPKSY